MTTPSQYTPRDLTALDVLGAVRQTADALLRNNPLTNAIVSRGLIKWIGNHIDNITGEPIQFLWIGEFFPGDTTLGGRAQRGISMVRDDSNGGISAFALYDHDPGGDGLGLRQTIHWTSGDGDRLFSEARHGGQQWPQNDVAMCPIWNEILNWPTTPTAVDANWHQIYEGWPSVVGNQLIARYFYATTGGAAGEFRIRMSSPSGDIIGPVHTLGVNANAFVEDTIDVSAERGNTRQFFVEARVTNGVGFSRVCVGNVRCFSNSA